MVFHSFCVSQLPPLSNYKRQQLLKLRKFNVFLSIRKFLVYFLVKNLPIKIEKRKKKPDEHNKCWL